ncbi:MAG: hypothetical protein M3Z04_12130 [Chloroflexota bacterium]|nr:hypothetical protein [Chloroflexota bacterium]
MTEIRRFGPEMAAPLPNPQIRDVQAVVIALGQSFQDRIDDPVWVERYQGNPLLLHNEGLIACLHFAAQAEIDEHDAPDDILFLIITGSGWVRVGGPDGLPVEVQAGDAVRWPAGILHKAWTTDSPMQAITVHYPMPAPGPT